MKAISYTAARENLAATINEVCEDRSPVIITRKRDQAVVMMSLEDYESLEETSYLLRVPANAQRLQASIQSLEAGEGAEREIVEIDEECNSCSRRRLGRITSIGWPPTKKWPSGSIN